MSLPPPRSTRTDPRVPDTTHFRAPTQRSIVSSNGSAIGTQPLNVLDMPDMLFVCGGTGIKEVCGNEIISTLRDLAARGVLLGSLCTGAYALARAGLLNGYRCSTDRKSVV